MKKIAILASGSGTNAENIARFFKKEKTAIVAMILSNNKDAYVLKRAENLEIPYTTFDREDFYRSDRVLNILQDHRIDLIVLAGFLWLIPDNILKAYPNRIVNIHPALLPKYGGKGMFGDRVHQAVIDNEEKESGISIHYVNEEYDEGEVIFQAKCPVNAQDTAESLAGKIHELEYKHFPEVVDRLLKEMD